METADAKASAVSITVVKLNPRHVRAGLKIRLPPVADERRIFWRSGQNSCEDLFRAKEFWVPQEGLFKSFCPCQKKSVVFRRVFLRTVGM